MKNKKLKIIILLFIVFFLIGCDTYVISPLIPEIAKDLNVKPGSGGYLVTIYSLFYVICSPFLGPISDRLGRKAMIITGTLIFSISSILTGMAQTFLLTMVFRGITGIGAAFAAPNVWAYIGDYFEYCERGKATAIIASALSLGMILGIPLGSFLADMMSWHETFYILGVLGIITFISAYFILENIKVNDSIENKNYIKQLKTVLNNKNVEFCFFTTLLVSFSNFGLYTFLGYWLNKCFSFNVSQIGSFMIVGGIGNLVGMHIGGRVGDKIGKKKTAYYSILMVGILLIIISMFKHSVILTGIVIFLWLAFGGASFSNVQVLITKFSNASRGTIMSFNNSFMWAGTAIGSVAIGLAIDNINFETSSIICGMAALTAFAVLKYYINE